MSYLDFEIGFWHPFGPHGRETPTHILERKRREIEANGYTLWSFQYRTMLLDWHRELASTKTPEYSHFAPIAGQRSIRLALERLMVLALSKSSIRRRERVATDAESNKDSPSIPTR